MRLATPDRTEQHTTRLQDNRGHRRSRSHYTRATHFTTTPPTVDSEKPLDIAALNVHGLNNKLIYDDLEELINNYHLVCLTETFINSNEVENINDFDTIFGYKLIHKPRLNFKRQSGGIAIAIRQDISKQVLRRTAEETAPYS